MVTMADISALARAIGAKFPEAERVVLFGSHAAGTVTADSDVDLLVVMRHAGSAARAAAAIHAKLDVSFPLDIVVRDAAEIERRIAAGDFFMREVMDRGQVLYEADHARVDRQGRGRPGHRSAVASVAQARPV
jgi:predicted nucleotidyltransferase